jgi:5-methylcytosine-specific restriction endonuclease McrA
MSYDYVTGNKEQYANFLKNDPRWKLMRRQVLERDDYTCAKCRFKSENPDVHHQGYDLGWLPGAYAIKPNGAYYLITLCHCCHLKHHHAKRERERDFMNGGLSWQEIEELIRKL